MTMRGPSYLAAGAAVAGLCVCLLATAGPAPAQSPTPTAVETPPDENKSDGPAPGTTETEILASQGATFAAKDRIAVFIGDVRVKDPRFQLASDKLTVFLAKEALSGGGTTSPTPAASPSATPAPLTASPAPSTAGAKGKNAPSANADETSRNSGGIDHAVAEGHVIIIQKRAPTKAGEEEKVSIGRAETVEFDNKTGDLTLRGWPKVEQNGNSHEALARSVVMVLHRDNSLDTQGATRTRLIQHPKESPSPGATPAASRRTPAPTPS